MMKNILLMGALALALSGAAEVIDVWPDGKMPGKVTDKAEVFADGEPKGDTNYTFVSHPTLTRMRAAGEGVHPAMVVCPGGGYWLLAWQKEGVEIAQWANRNGFDAFILKYRVPNDGTEAFMDAQRAVSLLRARAAELEIDPKRIAMIGFSAGANLTGRTANGFKTRSYPRLDAIDDVSSRPDAQLLIYPGGFLAGGFRAAPTPDLKLGAEFTPTPETPPAFITQTEDDFCNVENSLGYYLGCRKAKVEAAMLLGPKGGHGYGLRKNGRDNDTWPEVAATWLKRTLARQRAAAVTE